MFERRGFWSGLLAGSLLGILASAVAAPQVRRAGTLRRVAGSTVPLRAGARRVANRVSSQVTGWLKR